MGLMDTIADRIADRIVAKRQSQPERNDRARYIEFGGRQSEANVLITEPTALGESTAFAAGNLIARTVGPLPGDVRAARGPDAADGTQDLPEHPVAAMLNRAPNPEMSATSFRESWLMAAIFHGNGYAEIERDQSDRPVALWPIHPDRVQPCRTVNGTLYYEINNGIGEKTDLAAEDVLHLAGPSLGAGTVGFSIISLAKNDLGEAIAQGRYASNFIRNQAAPSGLITVSPGIQPTGMKRLRAEVEAMYSGPRKAGKIMIGDAGVDFKQIGVSPQDAEFLAQRRFSVETIARWFGVPPQMIGDTSKQTFANFEQAGLNFLALAVMPWVVRIEQEVNRKLLNRVAAGRARPFFKINTAAVVRANLEAQYRSFALGRQWGWLSVNDIRKLIDMDPIGPEGDVYLQPLNMEPSTGGNPPPDGQQQESPPANLRRIK